MDLSTGEAREAPEARETPRTPGTRGDDGGDHGDGVVEGGEPAGGVRARAAQPGQLTTGWRAVTALVWALVFVAFIAVWKTSRELGLATWWLGPLGQPQPWFVTMLPFLPPVAVLLLVADNSRRLPWAGLAGAASLALLGAFDVSRVPRLALVEVAVAAAGALVAVAGLAGRYRTAPAPPSEG